MLKYIIILAVIAVTTAASVATEKQKTNVDLKVLSSEELKAVLKKYPNAQPLNVEVTEDTTANMGESRMLLTYSFGKRVSGDFNLAREYVYNNAVEPQDWAVDISYPSWGEGKIITYFLIVVSQNNRGGQAYIIDGGIGERYITVVLEAYDTDHVNYDLYLFGL